MHIGVKIARYGGMLINLRMMYSDLTTLAGKAVLITGGATEIGRATAALLVEHLALGREINTSFQFFKTLLVRISLLIEGYVSVSKLKANLLCIFIVY